MSGSVLLSDRAVLAISGEEAHPFLQGLITNDTQKICSGEAIFAALLSPQGRFLHDFFIIQQKDVLLLETEKARLPDLIKRLNLYKLRSKVAFTERPELQVMAFWGNVRLVSTQGLVYGDPRLPQLGWRMLGENLKGSDLADEYDRHRLSLGVPEGSKDLIVDRSILLEYGYDELHAIDFAKGCYVGQEVTARSKHRASLRKFIHCVESRESLPRVGTPVLAGEREVGEMCSSNGAIGLAHLRAGDVRSGVALTAGGIPVQARLPAWCATALE